MRAVTEKLRSAFRQIDGPLTRDLVLQPGHFGLGRVPSRLTPDDTTSMVCGYCSTGCALNIHLREGQAVNLTPDAAYPVNLGMACPKGWEALAPLASADRATTPLLRDAHGRFQPLDWDAAMQIFSVRFKAIQDQHGPASVAVLSTGQIVTEEMAFLGALSKFGMGLLDCDSNTRQCMATSAVAYKQSFGFDAPPYTYRDFEESDVLIFFGSNLCITHPILWQRVLRNKNQPQIIVVDPRKTETAQAATRHYAIQPKSDLLLLYGLARLLLETDSVDREFVARHTSGFDAFEAFVSGMSLDSVATATGLSILELREFASVIAGGQRVSFWWTMGVNQGHEATRTAQAIINLALMTGQIGRPGTGANSITGQCNAMGSRLFSNTTNLLGGHDFTSAADRARVARILQLNETRIPQRPSLAYDQILDGIRADKIKGLWIIGTNPAHSWIHQGDCHKILDHLDFMVVQDMYHTTETAQRAHLLLPAAGWGEKEGTLINSERRFGLVKKVARAPGQALSDFNIFKLAAHYWGCGALFKDWTSPENVFQILKSLSAGQPCDFSGIRDYRMIDEAGGVQWPYPAGKAVAPAGERRLFEKGEFFHHDKRARFLFDLPRNLPEPPCPDFPMLLLSGRGTSSQWHTQTRTGKSSVLRKLYPQDCYLEINPADANILNIQAGQQVLISSRRGEITAQARVTGAVQPGHVFLPMHYPLINQLTFPAFDPHSRQPAYKACAVRVEPI